MKSDVLEKETSTECEFQPFLGRLKVEVIEGDVNEHFKKKFAKELGNSEEFLNKLEIVRGETVVDPVTGQKKFERNKSKLPITKGKIVSMSPDCFGKAFQDRFGNDREYPKIGDVVLFIANKSYALDSENRFHIIDDCEIVAFKRGQLDE